MTPQAFKKVVWKYYRENKRSFPWRETKDPYKILVSEIMLQQTQTERVRVKYKEWLEKFPTLQSLAQASIQNVLKTWIGLGYNRRALALKKTAEKIVNQYAGTFPKEYEKIIDLPGIGPYTAGAIMAFAYNKPFPIIETNIRTVYIHSFFGDQFGQIHDQEILELVAKTLDIENPRDCYYALMDYGVMLKKTLGNLNVKSRHYTKQSKFIGSNRQKRALLIKAITEKKRSLEDLKNYFKLSMIEISEAQLEKILEALQKEGFIKKAGQKFAIL